MENVAEKGWLTYIPILEGSNTLIGSCGYNGKPDKNGMVEIGYEVTEAYRGNGFASEMAKCLTNHALQQEEVKKVLAHTLPESNASTKVLQKIGFQKVAEVFDEEDGDIWRWELKK